MNKKKFELVVAVFLFVLVVSACGKKNEVDKPISTTKDVYLDAKTDAYDTIDKLESASDLIVIGTKTKELKSAVERDEYGTFMIAYTMSSFQIAEVVQNKIKEDKTEISIFENQAYDDVKNEVLHIAGYENMIQGNTYILYLQKAEEGYYIPLAVTTGKVALSKSEVTKKGLYNNEENMNLHKQIQQQYKDKMK